MIKEDYLKAYRDMVENAANDTKFNLDQVANVESDENGNFIFDYKWNCTSLMEEEDVLCMVGLLLLADQKMGIDQKRLLDACKSRIEDDIRDHLEWEMQKQECEE